MTKRKQKRKSTLKAWKALALILIVALYIVSVYWIVVPFVRETVNDSDTAAEAEVFEQKAEVTIRTYTETMEIPITNRRRIIRKTGEVVTETTLISRKKEEVPYANCLLDMIGYNDKIYEDGQINLTDAWNDFSVCPLDLAKYSLPSEEVATLEIPCMDVKFPVYLGATDEHMANGVAVLTDTSMPIGGENTNTVIAGHRGWKTGKFLRDIETVQLGDEIKLTNLWYEMNYRVAEIKLIYPNEINQIYIQPGRDLLTIMTCHPYGTGGKYYRYLLICEREQEDISYDGTAFDWVDPPDKTITKQVTKTVQEEVIGNKPPIEIKSSESSIVFEQVIRYVGMILLVLVPIVAIILWHEYRNNEKRKSEAELASCKIEDLFI